MLLTEDDTFRKLRRTDYRTVWERCQTAAEIDDIGERVIRIRAIKTACGWSEEEFRRQWAYHGASWEKFID